MGDSGFGAISRLFVALVMVVQLAACATQPREVARVTVGTSETESARAKDYAALYVRYAMMSAIAYTRPGGLDSELCPDAVKISRDSSLADPRVAAWIRQLNDNSWHCVFGRFGAGPHPCPRSFPDCKPVDGLEFHVWRRADPLCTEAVIAFRGTDLRYFGDLVSNFRWFLGGVRRFDEYDQVGLHINAVVHEIERRGCGRKGAVLIAAGHSLGGGLAQHAAYANRKIRYVYAFDPSPVTGFFDIDALLRNEDKKGLGIDRAYQAGELLALPRLILAGLFPPSDCDPRVRTVRFNVLPPGTLVEEHNISELTKSFDDIARQPGPRPRPVTAFREAASCTERSPGLRS
jgi:hypothetical protein